MTSVDDADPSDEAIAAFAAEQAAERAAVVARVRDLVEARRARFGAHSIEVLDALEHVALLLETADTPGPEARRARSAWLDALVAAQSAAPSDDALRDHTAQALRYQADALLESATPAEQADARRLLDHAVGLERTFADARRVRALRRTAELELASRNVSVAVKLLREARTHLGKAGASVFERAALDLTLATAELEQGNTGAAEALRRPALERLRALCEPSLLRYSWGVCTSYATAMAANAARRSDAAVAAPADDGEALLTQQRAALRAEFGASSREMIEIEAEQAPTLVFTEDPAPTWSTLQRLGDLVAALEKAPVRVADDALRERVASVVLDKTSAGWSMPDALSPANSKQLMALLARVAKLEARFAGARRVRAAVALADLALALGDHAQAVRYYEPARAHLAKVRSSKLVRAHLDLGLAEAYARMGQRARAAALRTPALALLAPELEAVREVSSDPTSLVLGETGPMHFALRYDRATRAVDQDRRAGPSFETVREVGKNTFVVPRAIAEQVLAEPMSLKRSSGSVHPGVNDEGLTLSWVRRGGLFARLGLQRGDLVRSIDQGPTLTHAELAAWAGRLARAIALGPVVFNLEVVRADRGAFQISVTIK